MDSRSCFVCKESKPVSEFHAGVRERQCKQCRKEYDKARRNRSKTRNDTDSARARKRRWNAANKDPVKQSARIEVRNAIRQGGIRAKDACEDCGMEKRRSDGARAVQAHHDDYSKPLDVRWLCAKCHADWHRKNDAAMKDTDHAR